MIAQGLQEVLLVLFQMNKRTVLFQPLLSSVAVISYRDGLGAVKDNGHIFVKIRNVIHRLSIELLLVEQKQRQKRFENRHILHHRNALSPLLQHPPPELIASVT